VPRRHVTGGARADPHNFTHFIPFISDHIMLRAGVVSEIYQPVLLQYPPPATDDKTLHLGHFVSTLCHRYGSISFGLVWFGLVWFGNELWLWFLLT
jgi:hypothetical protein